MIIPQLNHDTFFCPFHRALHWIDQRHFDSRHFEPTCLFVYSGKKQESDEESNSDSFGLPRFISFLFFSQKLEF